MNVTDRLRPATPSAATPPTTPAARTTGTSPVEAQADAHVRIPSRDLWKGMPGIEQHASDVHDLQKCLQHLGYMTPAQIATGPGVFGDQTKAALTRFQRDTGVPVTAQSAGSFGPATRAKMQALLGGGGPQRDLVDPGQTYGWGGAQWGQLQKQRFSGPLFQDGVSVRDVQQGTIGDCFFAGSAAALAAADPEQVKRMITDNRDGTYTVRFGGLPAQTVDGDLYVLRDGSLPYGKSFGTPHQAGKMETWFPILEKAYAQARGSYAAINGGDWPGNALTHITGRPHTTLGPWPSKDASWATLTSAVDASRPVVVYAPANNHTYAVVSYGRDHATGDRQVTMKNPFGGGPKGDGVFTINLDEFREMFQYVIAST